MKIRIKLNLYVLKEYLIATLCQKKNVGEGISKSSEMVVKMQKGSLTIIPVNTGRDHFNMTSLAHIMTD